MTNEIINFIFPNIKNMAYVYITLLILVLLFHMKFCKIAKKLNLPKKINNEISETADLFYSGMLFVGLFALYFPVINIMFIVATLLFCIDDISEKKILERYSYYLDENLKKIKFYYNNNKVLDLIKLSLLQTDNNNYNEIIEKFMQIVYILKNNPSPAISAEIEELKAIILEKSIVSKMELKEKDKITNFKKDSDLLNPKETNKYLNDLEYNKNNILKYLDNRTEGKYKTFLELALSKNKNPYYNVIIKNVDMLSTIIDDFENKNYILNEDKKENTKNEIRKSIFEFIEVIKLIDILNSEQDPTTKNIDNYNKYLESVKSDIINKTAIFGIEEHSL